MLESANLLSIPQHSIEKDEEHSKPLLNSMPDWLTQPAKGGHISQVGWISARRQYRGKSQKVTTENR